MVSFQKIQFFEEKVQQIWEAFPQESIYKLVLSFHGRLNFSQYMRTYIMI